MPAQLQFTLGDLVPWLEELSETLSKQINWQPAFKKIALLLEESTKGNFDGSHAPDGTPWKPLAHPRNRPRDQRATPGQGDSQKPLRDTGLLMASLSAHGQHHVERITDTVINWGTNLDYAGVHQFGHTFERPAKMRPAYVRNEKGELVPGKGPWVFTTPDGRKVFTRKIRAHQQTIPARPFLGLTPQLVDDIQQVVFEEVQRQVTG